MADRIQLPFAINGDRVDIPTASQGDGSVSYSDGYTYDYERDQEKDALAKNIEREGQNELFYVLTDNVKQYQENGFPDFYPASANGGSPVSYPINAVVRYNSKLWYSTANGNTTTPGVANSVWAEFRISGPGARLQRFEASGSFVVPDNVTTLYLSGAGGGGGGGGGGGFRSQYGAGGGGGGGAAASIIRSPLAVVPGETLNITIGNGGAAGTGGNPSAQGNNATPGGATTISRGNTVILSLAGGGFGNGGQIFANAQSAGGFGGSRGGQDGGDAINSVAGNGGSGGGGPFGTAGGGGRAGSNLAGRSATEGFGFGTGGGGGGGAYATSGPGSSGTAGMPGILLVEW